jgi:hypothetical protein
MARRQISVGEWLILRRALGEGHEDSPVFRGEFVAFAKRGFAGPT